MVMKTMMMAVTTSIMKTAVAMIVENDLYVDVEDTSESRSSKHLPLWPPRC